MGRASTVVIDPSTFFSHKKSTGSSSSEVDTQLRGRVLDIGTLTSADRRMMTDEEEIILYYSI